MYVHAGHGMGAAGTFGDAARFFETSTKGAVQVEARDIFRSRRLARRTRYLNGNGRACEDDNGHNFSIGA
jgi:hypothetical protein